MEPKPRTQEEIEELFSQLTRIHDSYTRLLSRANQSTEELESKIDLINERINNANNILESINKSLTEIQEIKTSAEKNRDQIAQSSAHIQDAVEHAALSKSEITKLKAATTTESEHVYDLASSAESHAKLVQAALEETKELSIKTKSTLEKTEEDSVAAKTYMEKTKGLAAISEAIESRVKSYEEKIALLHDQCKEQLNTISGLLPGATSAGLASAFDSRRKLFTAPAESFKAAFVWSMIAIIAVAATGLYQVIDHGPDLTWDNLAKMWVARLPIAAALIWLALYLSREYALAKRLEEDYGYKAAIASSFQGFQKQMKEITADADKDTPISILCRDTLVTLAQPPGRIYDAHKLTETPATEIIKTIENTVRSTMGKDKIE